MDDPKIPDYRYFPERWMGSHGPRAWARQRLLHTCKRLQIPEDLWPKFDSGGLQDLPRLGMRLNPDIEPAFKVPEFDCLNESVTEWRDRAEAAFRLHCTDYIERCLKFVEKMVNGGAVVKIEGVRDKNTPLSLRYEWAARRYCLREQFKEMASEEHSAEKIRKAVHKVFADVEINQRK